MEDTIICNTIFFSATEKGECCIVSNRGYVGNILIITLFDTISLPSNENHQKRGFKSGQYLLGNKTLYTEKQRKPENVAILEYQALYATYNL